MKANELVTVWRAPEPQMLTPKQMSIRLPMLVSAKIQALCDLFPRKTKTEIIGDLLDSALEIIENELPMKKDLSVDVYRQEDKKPHYGYGGIRKDYFKKVKKYLREMEKEANVKDPIEFSYWDVYPEADFKWE